MLSQNMSSSSFRRQHIYICLQQFLSCLIEFILKMFFSDILFNALSECDARVCVTAGQIIMYGMMD